MTVPSLDRHLRLSECVKYFAIELLIAELPVEAFDVTVLPWAARLDVSGLGDALGDPLAQGDGDKLRIVSLLTCSGAPRVIFRSANTSITSLELSRHATRIASASRVNSSTTQSMRIFRPSWVRSSTKS